ncbi:MAG: alpha/beta hydrolase, partial [Bdellovibrionaceae bacterium]|nr:alpha/beta hydrolase [Pseudobdellovibrionaceae bacterium]
AEPLFFETAGKEFNTAEDNVVLFFEPQSPNSRAESAASLQRMAARRDPGPKVDGLWAREWISGGPRNPVFPSEAVLEGLKTTSIPMLHIGGDHDIIFPVENWYALNQQIPNLQLLTFPSAGHGPQHQYAVASAEYIAIFLRTAKPAA